MFLIVVNSKSGKGHARSRASEFVDLCAKNGIRYKVLDKNSADETVIEIKKEILNPDADRMQSDAVKLRLGDEELDAHFRLTWNDPTWFWAIFNSRCKGLQVGESWRIVLGCF